jgi:hypothetical protein
MAAALAAGMVAEPEGRKALTEVQRASQTHVMNEIATGRATLEAEIAQAATVAREQRAAWEEQTAHPDRIAIHSTAAAVALASPEEAEVCIVLRFPQILSQKISDCLF